MQRYASRSIRCIFFNLRTPASLQKTISFKISRLQTPGGGGYPFVVCPMLAAGHSVLIRRGGLATVSLSPLAFIPTTPPPATLLLSSTCASPLSANHLLSKTCAIRVGRGGYLDTSSLQQTYGSSPSQLDLDTSSLQQMYGTSPSQLVLSPSSIEWYFPHPSLTLGAPPRAGAPSEPKEQPVHPMRMPIPPVRRRITVPTLAAPVRSEEE